MNPQIDKYKSLSEYIEEDNFYFYKNEEVNNTILAFKYDEETAFYIENPNPNDLKHFSEFLEVKDSNFLYLKSKSNLLYVVRNDKSSYAVYFFAKNNTKGCLITTKNSVEIIAKRFMENSLFDGRENEVRYLKEENWYNYGNAKTVQHPLINQSLKEIGKYLIPLYTLKITTEIQNHLNSPEFYFQKLFEDYSYVNFIKENKPVEIQQIEGKLSYSISTFFSVDNIFFIEYPYTSISRKKLNNLPCSYRYLNENQWYITLKAEEAFTNYSVNIQWTFKKQMFMFDIKGYNSILFRNLFNHLNLFESLIIGIARPIKRNEQTAKSIIIEYVIEENTFSTKFNNGLSKVELLQFLDEWID